MKFLTGILVVSFLISCKGQQSEQSQNIVRQNLIECNSPDAAAECMFQNAPTHLNTTLQIVEEDDINLVINGRIVDAASGNALSGIRMYAYHTNANGLYEKDGTEQGVQKWHGYLHGWCQTDEEGLYEIRTIRPAPYPSGQIPAHIHIYLELEKDNVVFINDIVFSDDPFLPNSYFENLDNEYNSSDRDKGMVELTIQNGIAYGHREIVIKF